MANLVTKIQEWFDGLSRRAELDRLGEYELNRIAGDAGASVGALYELSGRSPDAASLLPRRLGVLGFDPAELARKEPASMRDLERLCSLCESKGRCAHDLDRDPKNSAWESYCPNAATLRALR